MSDKWRWIDSPPANGYENMAVDEAILNCRKAGQPVFRTYTWEPEALSIGRFQNARNALKLETCAEDHIPVVRRITGGGIIHHHDELTYSLVCGQEDIAPGASVKESYRILCGFLIRFYRELGLEADFAVRSAPGTKLGAPSAFCFAGKEEYDITVNGKKIGGNAQRRFKGLVFQHGSIPIRLSRETSMKYLAERPKDLGMNTASLEELGISRTTGELKEILVNSFSGYFKTEIEMTGVFEDEMTSAHELLTEKYSTDKWNIDEIPCNFSHSLEIQG